MRTFAVLLCMMLVMVFAPAVMAAPDVDDNAPDTLLIGKAALLKAGKATVRIEFINDQDLAALTIPIGVKGAGVKVDSVSFAGSRVEYVKTRPVTINENGQIIFGVICMTEDFVAPGRGLMATLYMSVSDSAKVDQIKVDTTTVHPAELLFTKASSASFVPTVVQGALKAPEAAKKEKQP
ncbi:MAG: hypothetical protein PHR28_10135 [candidate division Zixibacteria bacterium]|nr:hypothetical protein [candidate division Zixibacteria bacterium]